MAQDGTKTGNGNGEDLAVTADRWNLFEVWGTFDGGNVSLEAKVDESTPVYMPLRDESGAIRTLSGAGSFEFRTSANLVRPVLAGGGGSEDIVYRVRRVQ